MADFKFDTGHIDRIYEEISSMAVDLDDDPIRYGPKRINAKVAHAKKLVSRCTELEIALSRDLNNLNRKLRAAQADLELAMQGLFTTDPEVRAGRSVKDREAIATMKLRDESMLVRLVEQAVEEVKSAILVVKTQKADLKDTQSRLRDQIRLIHEEISLGSMWGSAPAPDDKDIKPIRSNGVASSSSGKIVDSAVAFDEDEDDYSDLNGIASFGDGTDAFGENADDFESTDELGTMLAGDQTDNDADDALEALSEEEPKEEPTLMGLSDDHLDALLGEDF